MTWWVISVLSSHEARARMARCGRVPASSSSWPCLERRLGGMGAGSAHALLSRAGDFCIIGQAACSYMHAASDELRYLVNRVVTISDVKTMQ